MHKKVSIIVPVYNAKKYLDRCMVSLLEQSMPQSDYEIILVDDGSKDGAGKLCDDYSERHACVTAIHQQNAGSAAARNAGLERATGEYVAFVDPDDFVEKEYLEAPYNQGIRSGADIVLFDAYRERISDNSSKRELWRHTDKEFTTTEQSEIHSMQRQILYPYISAKVGTMTFCRNIPLAAPWDKLYRRAFLNNNNLLFPSELRVLDDMCFNFKVFGAAKTISYIPVFLYHYLIEETSITNSYRADRVQQDIKVFEYIEKSIMDMHLDEKGNAIFRQALFARIIKSFTISLRLYFFNANNLKTESERTSEVKTCITSEPYIQAFRNVWLSILEPKLIAVTMLCRLKIPRALRLIYRLQYGK